MNNYENKTETATFTQEIVIEKVGDWFGLILDTCEKSKLHTPPVKRLTIKAHREGIKIYTDNSSYFLTGEDLVKFKQFIKEVQP